MRNNKKENEIKTNKQIKRAATILATHQAVENGGNPEDITIQDNGGNTWTREAWKNVSGAWGWGKWIVIESHYATTAQIDAEEQKYFDSLRAEYC